MDRRFSSTLSPGKEATLGIGPGRNAERKDVMVLACQKSDGGGGGGGGSGGGGGGGGRN